MNSTKDTWLILLLVARVCTSLGHLKLKNARVLIDSGASNRIVSASKIAKTKEETACTWNSATGPISIAISKNTIMIHITRIIWDQTNWMEHEFSWKG